MNLLSITAKVKRIPLRFPLKQFLTNQPVTAIQKNHTYFMELRKHTIGANHKIKTTYGEKDLMYVDWTASGRLYAPIEHEILYKFGPMIANTHTESNTSGSFSTRAYEKAREIIKKHVNASKNDVLISYGSGTTDVVNKFQRILGLRVDEKFVNKFEIKPDERPVVFITHMEHHSNHTSWLETIADVVIVEPNEKGEVEPKNLEKLLVEYKDRPLKIGSFTACSNVTGVLTPYYELAEIMHTYGGYCFVDFAASAPYVEINMHPENPAQRLDAIFFSPHKFLGGPGSSGILVFTNELYNREVPDNPGGGTVSWTNRWNERKYVDDIEAKEDGGTPAIIQTVKTALCIKLKEDMLKHNMKEVKDNLFSELWNGLKSMDKVVILDEDKTNRLSILSFYLDIPDFSYNLVVKMLDEKFGIQVRGGCSCAGTYGHYLLNIDRETSKDITNEIDKGNLSRKPGWIRVSLHPTNTLDEVKTFTSAIQEVITHYDEWKKEYTYKSSKNEYESGPFLYENDIEELFVSN